MASARYGSRAPLLATLLLIAPAALAGDSQGRFAIKGAGAETCAAYTAKRNAEAPETYMFLGWLQGWLSHENRVAEGTFDLASWQHPATLLAAMDAYCGENPEHPFVYAADALIAAMRPSRLGEQSLLITVEADGRRVELYAQTLKRLQDGLRQEGLLSDSTNGELTPETEAAIRAYQEREGLPITGLPDQTILQRLVHQPAREKSAPK